MKDLLDSACDAYYTGKPFLSDEEFDFLAEKYNYNSVGHQVTDAIPHVYQMYSLQKCFDLDNAPLDIALCDCTPKLDGAAVSLLYVNGYLELSLTRGDGIHGRDITDKMRTLVPSEIMDRSLIQITGEVVAPSSVPNSRNFAAGSLGLKDVEEFQTRPLLFVAYDSTPELSEQYTNTLRRLEIQGFNVVDRFDSTHYPTDGTVYRLSDNSEYISMGHTSKHPRGAFALKEQKAGVVTKLLEVKWQVGKSGVVSPVAILEPVEIGGAVVSRATLHNIDYIRALNLQLECLVEVIRSGEIIPRIVRRVD